MAEVREGLAMMRAGYAMVAAASMDLLTKAELVEVGDELESLTCQLPTQRHRMLARLQIETTPREMGAKSWREVLATRWRISTGEAGRRLAEAAELGPRQGLTGQPLAPVLAAVAAAQDAGLINGEHVTVLRDTMKNMPGWVDTVTRSQIEVDLVSKAAGVGPKELKSAADRELFLLDQDGPEPDDAERTRKRAVSIGKQCRDGTSALSRLSHPRSTGNVGADLREIRRTGHVQSGRSRTVRVRHPQPDPDRQRPPHHGPTPARRHGRDRADRA